MYSIVPRVRVSIDCRHLERLYSGGQPLLQPLQPLFVGPQAHPLTAQRGGNPVHVVPKQGNCKYDVWLRNRRGYVVLPAGLEHLHFSAFRPPAPQRLLSLRQLSLELLTLWLSR